MPPTPTDPQTSPPLPDGTEFDPTRVEPFRLLGANIVEALPEENPALPGPHITFVLVGLPPWGDPQQPKTYLTSVSPKLAVELGTGLADTGRALAGDGPAIVKATPGDMRAATQAADALGHLRT